MIKLPEYFYQSSENTIIRIGGVTILQCPFKSDTAAQTAVCPYIAYFGGRNITENQSGTDEFRFNLNLTSNFLIFIIKGKKKILTGERSILLEKGTGAFLPRGNYIMSQLVENKDDDHKSFLIFLDDDVIARLVNENSELFKNRNEKKYDIPFFYQFNSTPFFDACIESFAPYFIYRSSMNESVMKLKITELLLNLTDTDKEGSLINYMKNLANESGQSIVDYMTENYTKPLNVEDFAKQTNRSLSSFKKEFKKEFNSPPKEWINKMRLKKAKILMENTGHSITDIGFFTGFHNYSYFIQLFKNEYGMTPKQYQMQLSKS